MTFIFLKKTGLGSKLFRDSKKWKKYLIVNEMKYTMKKSFYYTK